MNGDDKFSSSFDVPFPKSIAVITSIFVLSAVALVTWKGMHYSNKQAKIAPNAYTHAITQKCLEENGLGDVAVVYPVCSTYREDCIPKFVTSKRKALEKIYSIYDIENNMKTDIREVAGDMAITDATYFTRLRPAEQKMINDVKACVDKGLGYGSN